MLPTIRSTRVILALAVAAVWACGCFTSGMAHAAKLDDAACDALKVERARLDTDAIKSDMAKGPQWAKDNLTPERLKEIEQLIGLQESIAFRCTLPKANILSSRAFRNPSGPNAWALPAPAPNASARCCA